MKEIEFSSFLAIYIEFIPFRDFVTAIARKKRRKGGGAQNYLDKINPVANNL